MQQNKPSPILNTTKMLLYYGIIFSIIIAITSIIVSTFDIKYIIEIGVWVVAAIIIFCLTHKKYKDLHQGFMSYKKGIGIGILVALISAVLASILEIIYFKLLNPSLHDQMQEELRRFIEENVGIIEEEAIEEMVKKLFSAPAIVFSRIFVNLFMGTAVALFVSTFTKRKKPVLDEKENLS